jgi:hypothetical protein
VLGQDRVTSIAIVQKRVPLPWLRAKGFSAISEPMDRVPELIHIMGTTWTFFQVSVHGSPFLAVEQVFQIRQELMTFMFVGTWWSIHGIRFLLDSVRFRSAETEKMHSAAMEGETRFLPMGTSIERQGRSILATGSVCEDSKVSTSFIHLPVFPVLRDSVRGFSPVLFPGTSSFALRASRQRLVWTMSVFSCTPNSDEISLNERS